MTCTQSKKSKECWALAPEDIANVRDSMRMLTTLVGDTVVFCRESTHRLLPVFTNVGICLLMYMILENILFFFIFFLFIRLCLIPRGIPLAQPSVSMKIGSI